MQVVTLPELEAPAKIVFDEEQRFDDRAFTAFCAANPDLKIERTSKGEIVIVPPAGGESSYQSADAVYQLKTWNVRGRNGEVFDSSGAFTLPNGAVYAPDASWVSNERLSQLTKQQRREFLQVVPEFVIEVMSPSDRLPKARRRAQEWIDEGVELVWLIDGDAQTIYIYRRGREPEQLTGVTEIAGEGPVAGFVLSLVDIWKGL